MSDIEKTRTETERIYAAQVNRALGVFLLGFGGIVLIAVFFTDSTIGQLVNLAAGSTIVLIGAGMFWKGKRYRP